MSLLMAIRAPRNQVLDDVEKVLAFLSDKRTGTLATVNELHDPHSVVLYYVVGEDLRISFLTKCETQQSKNIRLNPKVMFVVYDELSQTIAQITGRAQEVKSTEKAHTVFRNALKSSLHTAESAIPPISKLNAGEYIAYEIIPSEIKLSCYNRRSSEHKGKLAVVLNEEQLCSFA